jgi:hypothetical protein
MKRSVLVTALVMLASALASMSCGVPLEMSGTVAEWRNAPPHARSTVILNAPATIPPRELVALDGVEVRLQTGANPGTSDRRAPFSRAQTTSDAGGHFSLGVFVRAGLPHARETFRKPGFEPVDVETSETRLDQVVVALVREPS